MHINRERMKMLLGRRDRKGRGPFLHLNETEAKSFSGMSSLKEAALLY
jgi:hypothetical protein